MDLILKFLLGLGLAGIATNGLLVATVLKIKKRHDDMNLALALSAADIAVASTTVAASFLRVSHYSPILCRLVGLVDFALLFVAMVLVALISLVRWSRVVNRKIPVAFWVFTGAMSLLYFPAVVLSTLRSEFEVSPSGLDCASHASALSLAVASLLGIGMLVLLVFTLWGYLSILLHFTETSQRCFLPKALTPTVNFHSPAKQPQPNRAVLARILGMAIVYVTLIVPPATILLASHVFRLADTVKLIFAVFISTFSIANPCLVLFAHSTIYLQLVAWFRPSRI